MTPIAVLLVSDDADFLRRAAALLRELKAEDLLLLGSITPDEAWLQRVSALRPGVVVVDLVAGADASGPLRRLRQKLPHTRLVAVVSSDVDVDRAAAAGADQIVRRDVMNTELWPAIRRAAVRERADPGSAREN